MLSFSLTAQALTVHETWVTPQAPMANEIDAWKKMKTGEENRSYLIQLGDPTSFELQQLLTFDISDHLRLEVTRIPGEDVRKMYTQLAGRGAEFISLQGSLPTEDEANRLKKIGFSTSVFAIAAAPNANQAKLLNLLPGKVSVSLVLRHYPKFVERDQFLALPATSPLLFIMDFWPDYTHMDVLNTLPHMKRLRVRDVYPPESQLPYVNAIKNLEEISFELQSLPDLETWKKMVRSFPGKNLQWITHVAPTKEHISVFVQSAQGTDQRRITVDSDLELPGDIQAALKSCPAAVDWIHATPFPSQTTRAF